MELGEFVAMRPISIPVNSKRQSLIYPECTIINGDLSVPPVCIYLADPEVFLSNAKEIGKKQKSAVQKIRVWRLFPLDNEVNAKGKSAAELGLCISALNENLIKTCGIVIANLLGSKRWCGNCLWDGFCACVGQESFCITNVAVPFTEHTIESLSNEVKLSADGKLRDAQSMFIEEVGLTDNLRLYGYIHASSKRLVIKQAPANKPFTYLVGFEKCLIAAKKMQTG